LVRQPKTAEASSTLSGKAFIHL